MSEFFEQTPERIGPEREQLPDGDELSELGKAFVGCIECILRAEAAVAALEDDKTKHKSLTPTERNELRHTWRENEIMAPRLFEEVRRLATIDTNSSND